jgi:hypothetical protein
VLQFVVHECLTGKTAADHRQLHQTGIEIWDCTSGLQLSAGRLLSVASTGG